ncbi:MAG: hypothetical protein ABSF33_12955 [Acidimicrobiales bacterium]
MTEVTSIGHHFTAGAIETAWSIVVIVLIVAARHPIVRSISMLWERDRSWLGLREHLANVSLEEWIWFGVLVAMFGILVAVGAQNLPNNGDAMVYHLARVEHWVQDRTIAPFAAHYLPQVEFSPLAEYNLAHLHLMAGTDRFDAAVQLLAAVVSVVGVTELARLLGASRWAQVMSALICATIPTGILLATTAENDYVAAAMGIVLLVLLAAYSFSGPWLWRALAVGTAAGLTYMTKSSMLLLIGPAAAALVAVVLYREIQSNGPTGEVRPAVGQLLVIPLGALAMVLPFASQNIQKFGSVEGSGITDLTVHPITLPAMAANVVRSTASEFDVGNGKWGPENYLARAVLPVLRHMYSVFGIAPNDERYAETRNWPVFKVLDWSIFQRMDDYGANPWHVLLIVLALIVLAMAALHGRKRVHAALVFGIGLGFGYVLFTGIYRWNQFGVRLVLPLVVAFSVVIAIALAPFSRWVGRVVLAGLIVACLPELLDHAEMPLVPAATSQTSYLLPYFYPRSRTKAEEASAYETITGIVAQSACTKVGIGNQVLSEYPLWVGLGHNHWKGVLNDVAVDNATKSLEPSYRPCAIVTQQNAHYVTPDNGMVNVQISVLDISFATRNATSVHTQIPAFTSSVSGVRLLPGGGWRLASKRGGPQLVGKGSLFLFSDVDRKVELQLYLLRNTPTTLPAITGAGQSVTTTRGLGTINADLDLRAGINIVRLTPGKTLQMTGQVISLSRATVVRQTP